ncbi:hypothetical protein L7F22_038206 [Adiantum nelumboides]|nr:hypothetical protein [Adiantum nelumboides]
MSLGQWTRLLDEELQPLDEESWLFIEGVRLFAVEVLRMKYGFHGSKPLSLFQIAGLLKVTHEAVRKTEKNAFEKGHLIFSLKGKAGQLRKLNTLNGHMPLLHSYGEEPHGWLSSLPCGKHAIPPAAQPLLWQSAALPTRPDGDATIIDFFLGNLDVKDPTTDDDPAEDEDSRVDDDLHATKADVAAVGAATLAAMPFVNHAADAADAAATLPSVLDATAADEVRAASDATVTKVTPASQPADEPTAVNNATTPLELPTLAAKKDALAAAVTTSVAIIAAIAVVANLAAIRGDGTDAAVALGAIPAEAPAADEVHSAAIEEAVAAGNLTVDPDAMALADGPHGDEPVAAKLAAFLAEEDEAAQDGAEIVAAPNPTIGEAACMSHPF